MPYIPQNSLSTSAAFAFMLCVCLSNGLCIFFQDKPKFPLADVDKASKYLATKTFESLNEMFTASQQIQVKTLKTAEVSIDGFHNLVLTYF